MCDRIPELLNRYSDLHDPAFVVMLHDPAGQKLLDEASEWKKTAQTLYADKCDEEMIDTHYGYGFDLEARQQAFLTAIRQKHGFPSPAMAA